jgi:hypothetical protein
MADNKSLKEINLDFKACCENMEIHLKSKNFKLAIDWNGNVKGMVIKKVNEEIINK